MATIVRLDPPIELNTPRGHALCHFMVYEGAETDVLWGCFQSDGQIWFWPNPRVRAVRNVSFHRDDPEIPVG